MAGSDCNDMGFGPCISSLEQVKIRYIPIPCLPMESSLCWIVL